MKYLPVVQFTNTLRRVYAGLIEGDFELCYSNKGLKRPQIDDEERRKITACLN